MALLNQAIQVAPQLSKFFETIREGTAPEKFTREHLKDIGFTSSNHLAFIPLLKGLNFLSSDGTPTERYRNYLDKSRSKKVMAEAVKEAYSDIFIIRARPSKADKDAVEGKFKSAFNSSELTASRNASTFFALLDLCDKDFLSNNDAESRAVEIIEKHADREGIASPAEASSGDKREVSGNLRSANLGRGGGIELGLRYNIQIHLPPTKDIEVYNAIFRSIRDHLID